MKRFRVTVNGNIYDVEVEEVLEGQHSQDNQDERSEEPESRAESSVQKKRALSEATRRIQNTEPGEGTQVKAPLTGTILSVKVGVGSSVNKGDVLVSLEALKMENEIQSPVDGTVSYVGVSQGQNVEAGTVLVVIR